MGGEQLIPIGSVIILIGFALVIVGSILSFFKQKGKAEGGFIFMIGPFPIVGATSKAMFYTLVTLALVFLFCILLLNFVVR